MKQSVIEELAAKRKHTFLGSHQPKQSRYCLELDVRRKHSFRLFRGFGVIMLRTFGPGYVQTLEPKVGIICRVGFQGRSGFAWCCVCLTISAVFFLDRSMSLQVSFCHSSSD